MAERVLELAIAVTPEHVGDKTMFWMGTVPL